MGFIFQFSYITELLCQATTKHEEEGDGPMSILEEKRMQMLHRKNEILARIVVGMSL